MSSDFDTETEYAVLPREEWRGHLRAVRPYRGRYVRDDYAGTCFLLHGRVDDVALDIYPESELMVLGRLDDQAHPLIGPGLSNKTWRQIIAHYAGQELRKRTLVTRLQEAGISSPFSRGLKEDDGRLALTFDELDELLSKAGH